MHSPHVIRVFWCRTWRPFRHQTGGNAVILIPALTNGVMDAPAANQISGKATRSPFEWTFSLSRTLESAIVALRFLHSSLPDPKPPEMSTMASITSPIDVYWLAKMSTVLPKRRLASSGRSSGKRRNVVALSDGHPLPESDPFRRERENIWMRKSFKVGFIGRQEIHRRLMATATLNDCVVEIGIRQKADHNAQGPPENSPSALMLREPLKSRGYLKPSISHAPLWALAFTLGHGFRPGIKAPNFLESMLCEQPFQNQRDIAYLFLVLVHNSSSKPCNLLKINWLPDMDSNHDSRLQRPLSYH